ncbi:MAG: 23S rRNA (pseudouridine(1915)-N(3))-methyltransferase RlmH [Pseudomonadota bacterium]
MRIVIGAVGRLKTGPEKTLVDEYLDRFTRTGRPLALGPVDVRDVDERKATTPEAHAAVLEKLVTQTGRVVALDERGSTWSSRTFAVKLASWRDAGQQEVVFLIGGADGLHPGLRDQAQVRLSLGQMVWPHMLARVMLAEQLYRASTILAGTPYHRD